MKNLRVTTSSLYMEFFLKSQNLLTHCTISFRYRDYHLTTYTENEFESKQNLLPTSFGVKCHVFFGPKWLKTRFSLILQLQHFFRLPLEYSYRILNNIYKK